MSMDFNNLNLIMEEIEKFEANGCSGEISTVLDEFLRFVAKTGDPLLPWNRIKGFLRYKLSSVMGEFFDIYGGEEMLETTNTPSFSYAPTRNKILQHFDSFVGAPFTIQRLCEILIDPRRHYKRTDKFLRGLEKNILVVSFVEPGHTKRMREQQNMANGLQDMSPPHMLVASSIDLKKGSNSSSPLSSEDVEMAEVSEGTAGIAATTNGVSEDSSSSSSSSSSSASSSPTLDDDPHDLGPLPKRPRLDPSPTDNKMEDHENTATALSPVEPPADKSPPGSPISRDQSGDEMKADASDGVVPPADEPKMMEEDGGENVEEEGTIPDACEARPSSEEELPRESDALPHEVGTSQGEEDASSASEGKEALGLSVLSEVGSSNHVQEEGYNPGVLTPQKESSNEGSPDSAQDSAQAPECDAAAVAEAFKDTDSDSEAAAASMRRSSEEAVEESEPVSTAGTEDREVYAGSEADSTSFQSSPLSSPPLSSAPTVSSCPSASVPEPQESLECSKLSAVDDQSPSGMTPATTTSTTSSTPLPSAKEEKTSLDSSTSDSPPQQKPSSPSLRPDDDAEPQTQVISTSRREDSDRDVDAPPASIQQDDDDESCSSSNP